MKTDTNSDIALLVIRVAIGLGFLTHGTAKFGNFDFFTSVLGQAHVAPVFAYVFIGIEIIGAILVLIGISTGWTGIVLALEILFLTIFVKIPFDPTLFLAVIAITLAGPGSWVLKLRK